MTECLPRKYVLAKPENKGLLSEEIGACTMEKVKVKTTSGPFAA